MKLGSLSISAAFCKANVKLTPYEVMYINAISLPASNSVLYTGPVVKSLLYCGTARLCLISRPFGPIHTISQIQYFFSFLGNSVKRTDATYLPRVLIQSFRKIPQDYRQIDPSHLVAKGTYHR